jgi:hypothetical protein
VNRFSFRSETRKNRTRTNSASRYKKGEKTVSAGLKIGRWASSNRVHHHPIESLRHTFWVGNRLKKLLFGTWRIIEYPRTSFRPPFCASFTAVVRRPSS